MHLFVQVSDATVHETDHDVAVPAAVVIQNDQVRAGTDRLPRVLRGTVRTRPAHKHHRFSTTQVSKPLGSLSETYQISLIINGFREREVKIKLRSNCLTDISYIYTIHA